MADSPELAAALQLVSRAQRALDDIERAHAEHPFPWRVSKARNLVDATGVIVSRPGLPKRQVAALARASSRGAAYALITARQKVDDARAVAFALQPPQPGIVGVVIVDGQQFVIEVPDVNRVRVQDVTAGIRAAGLACTTNPTEGKIHVAAPAETSRGVITCKSARGLMRAWDFEFVAALPEPTA